jgi:hypothetical protein
MAKRYDKGKASDSDVVTAENTTDIEYRLVKHLTNDYHSPIRDFIEQKYTRRVIEEDKSAQGDTKKYRIKDDARRLLFEGKPEVIPYFCFGSYNISLVFPNDKRWDTHDINFVPRMGGAVEVAGDISVSSHGFTMYRFSKAQSQGNTMSVTYAEDNAYFLSDMPYLAHVAVVIRPEYYNRKNNGKYIRDDHEKHEEIYQELYNNIQAIVGKQKASFEVFYSLHTADFIIVLRTAEPSLVYKLSMSLSGDSNYYITHTIQSLEIGVVDNITTPNDFDLPLLYRRPKISKDNNISFLAKFSASAEFQKELVSRCRTNASSLIPTAGEGTLLGFFDMQVNLTPVQFSCLYPALCENRLFKDDGGHDWVANTIQFRESTSDCDRCGCDCTHCPAYAIGAEILKSKNRGKYCRISSLGIDLLYDMGNEIGVETVTTSQSAIAKQFARVEYVRAKTLDLVKRITNLREKQLLIPRKRSLYISSINLLLDLVRVYAPMAEQADLFLTGRVVCEYIEYLIDGIEKAVGQISEHLSIVSYNVNNDENSNDNAIRVNELSREGSRARVSKITTEVIKIIRHGVDAVNSFSRLTMGVNLQFINAANYELLTQTSAHKILCAYYEFAHELSEDYSNDNPGDNGIANRNICVLPIPHFDSVQPEAQLLYPHGYVDLELSEKPPEKPPVHPAVARFPNIDTFLRVYEIVPYLRHEYNHFLHLRKSDETNNCVRNKYLLRNTMTDISQTIIFGLVDYAGVEYAILFNDNQRLQRLIDSVSDVLVAEFIDDSTRRSLLPNMLFDELRAALIRYLEKALSYAVPDTNEKLSRKSGVDLMFDLINKYANPNDPIITQKYLKILKNNAYYAFPLNRADNRMQNVYDAFIGRQLFGALLQQIDDSINDIRSRLSALENVQINNTDNRKTADRSKLRNLYKQELKRKETFFAEWEYVEKLFFDVLQQLPYGEDNHNGDEDIFAVGSDAIKKNVICKLVSALDENIADMELSGNIPLRLIQEYEKIRVWIKRKGNQAPLFWKLHKPLIESGVYDCFTVYNEARSDIFMCKTLSFNTAGYVYFLIRSLSRIESEPLDAIFYRRVLVTMHALSKKAETLSTSILYCEFAPEYELLVNARVAYLRTKIDYLCDEILKTAPRNLLKKKTVDITDFTGSIDLQPDSIAIQLKFTLREDVARIRERLQENFLEMCKDKLDTIFCDTMDAMSDESETPIETFFKPFPEQPQTFSELSQISAALSGCHSTLRDDDGDGDDDFEHIEQRKRCENFIDRYNSMLALCADQLSDLLAIEMLLYKIRRLPECRAYETEHAKAIANVYGQRYATKQKTHNNTNIDHVISRIGEYYNGTCGEDIASKYMTSQMTADGVKFVNEFYWKNRARMAQWRESYTEQNPNDNPVTEGGK